MAQVKFTGTDAIQTVKDEGKNTGSDVLGTAKEGAASVKGELRALGRAQSGNEDSLGADQPTRLTNQPSTRAPVDLMSQG